MSAITATPAASRIAQIRSAMGRHSNANGGGAFALQLDSVRTPSAASSAIFSVGQPPTQPVTETASVLAAATTDAAPASPALTSTGSTTVRGSVPYAALFNEAGERYGVDPALLASVAQIESAFDPTAISSAGAQGLMQFMPATAGEMGVDSFDPASAVDGAARYLRRELDRFGSVDLALAAYNAGAGAVQRHGGIPPFAETQRYVEKVLSALESHR